VSEDLDEEFGGQIGDAGHGKTGDQGCTCREKRIRQMGDRCCVGYWGSPGICLALWFALRHHSRKMKPHT